MGPDGAADPESAWCVLAWAACPNDPSTDGRRTGDSGSIRSTPRPCALTGDYVLYWMIASRRTEWNFASGTGGRALPAAGPAADRPRGAALRLPVGQRSAAPLRPRRHGRQPRAAAVEGRALLPLRGAPSAAPARACSRRLPQRAAVVVTDDYPSFFLPRMVAAAGRKLDVRLEQVDGNGLLPLAAAGKVYGRAYDFRRFLQASWRPTCSSRRAPIRWPVATSAGGARVARKILQRWPPAPVGLLRARRGPRVACRSTIRCLPVARRGGAAAAARALERFVDERLVVATTRSATGRWSRHQRTVAVPALRPHLAAPGLRRDRRAAEGWNPGASAASTPAAPARAGGA